MSQLRAALVLTVLFTLLTGLAYPLAVTGASGRSSCRIRRMARW